MNDITYNKIFIYLIIIVSTIILWRSLWNLADKYWFPNNKYSDQIGIVVGLILLIFIKLYSDKVKK